MLLLVALLLPALAGEPTLTVEVYLRAVEPDRAGTLRCALWAGPDGWPSSDDGALARVQVRPEDPLCRFTGVQPGPYAVSVLHDEDGDGDLDTNLLGIPREGWGTSRDVVPTLRAPTFDGSRTAVDAAHTTLDITLHY